MTITWRAHLKFSDLWFDLPLESDRTQEELEAQVDERIQREPALAPYREPLVEMLVGYADAADQRRAAAAGARCELSELDVMTVATADLAIWPRPEASEAAEIETILARVRERQPTDRTEPNIEVRKLRAGDAVRVHLITRAEPDETDDRDAERVTYLETVQYWLPVPGEPYTLLVAFATPNLAAAEELVPEFDVLADRVEIRPN